MSLLLLWIAGVVAIALVWWVLRRTSGPKPALAAPPVARQPVQRSAPPAKAAAPVPAAVPPGASAAPTEHTPFELRAFQWLKEADLEAPRRDALMGAIKGIPRPPRSLQKLLSPDFVARANSTELSELVLTEPLIAAKVLSTVNGPFYGLRQPVNGIGQAVTFLGMNTVRNICMQYMLAEAFKPSLATSQQAFDAIWRASAIASELCVRLGKALNLPDQATLATQVVLGFVGHLATASLMPPKALSEWSVSGRLQRAQLEQAVLDLTASEIGGLLMRAWDLPLALVDDVCDSSRVLVTPVSQADPLRAPRLALSYLCSRLGERLASGQLASLRDYDALQDADIDTFHLRGYLALPALARLNEALQADELQTALNDMLSNRPARA